MIFDKIENLRQYAGIDERFNAIADFIEKNNLKAIQAGGYEVCDGVKVNISEYEPALGGDYEAHRCFNDLQYAITGGEAIDVIPASEGRESTGYKPDIEFFKEKNCEVSRIALDEGTFAFLAPQDAHKPCIKTSCDKIRKAVFKIEI